jgi:hypothetical protein
MRGCSPGRLTDAQRLARLFLPFGERVGEAWAVGTLRAVAAFAAAELGEAGRGPIARRAGPIATSPPPRDSWGCGFALVRAGRVASGPGGVWACGGPLDRSPGESEKVAHPLLVGMAGTVRGFVALDRGDPEAAELDARSVLTMVSPYGVP